MLNNIFWSIVLMFITIVWMVRGAFLWIKEAILRKMYGDS
jgi:hypothetical protein